MFNQNDSVSKAILAGYQKSFDTLTNLLSDPNASPEDKRYWSEELFKCLREMREYDKDNKAFLNEQDNGNKKFLEDVLKCVGVAAVALLTTALAVFAGGKIGIPGKSNDK